MLKDRLVNLADPGGRRYLRFSVALEFEEHHDEAHAAANPWSHLVTYTSELPASRSRLVAYTPGDAGNQPATGGGKDADKEFQASIKKYVPAIEDSVMSVLSAKTYADVAKNEGRDAVKLEIGERLNALLDGTGLHVTNVYFTDFVIQ